MSQDDLKRRAAERAADLVEDGMKLGLGSGSTAHHVLRAIAARRDRGELQRIVGVPTSAETEHRAREFGIPLSTLDEETHLDLTLDGADEVDPGLDVIKGLGGALLWEKIVAWATDRVVIVVDESKLVQGLGTRSPLPVEVIPFGWRTLLDPLRAMGVEYERRATEDGAPYVTDAGHWILDCRFPGGIGDARRVEDRLHALPGVVETGLFLGVVDTVVVAASGETRVLTRETR